MSFEITKEMKVNTAKNIFEEISNLKRAILSYHINSIFTADDVIEKMGYTIDCCVYGILRELEVEDDNCGENFSIVSNCIMDDDTFEYLVEKLKTFGEEA